VIDEVTIDFGASTYVGWTDYELTSDILTPADGWSVQLPMSGTIEQRHALKERIRSESGLRCFIYVRRSDSTDRALQLSGIIDDIGFSGSREGAILNVRGRDVGGLLCDASADVNLGVEESTSLLEVLRATCDPFGIEVTAESFASRALLTGERAGGDPNTLVRRAARAAGIAERNGTRALVTGSGPPQTAHAGHLADARARARARLGHAAGLDGRDIEAISVSDAKPNAGETCWEFIDRQCRRFGAMPWIAADGKLIVSSPHYDQEPLYSLTRYLGRDSRNTIVAGGGDESLAAQSSSATVYGRGPGRDTERTRFRGFAERNTSLMPLYRPLVVHDPSITSQDEATRRAKRELAQQNVSAFALEYEVHGHGQGPYLWAVDTIAEVVDEQQGVEGLYWIASRTFRGNRDIGRTTKLRLLPVGAVTL
jgi:prophage tail gpP-like protein